MAALHGVFESENCCISSFLLKLIKSIICHGTSNFFFPICCCLESGRLQPASLSVRETLVKAQFPPRAVARGHGVQALSFVQSSTPMVTGTSMNI